MRGAVALVAIFAFIAGCDETGPPPSGKAIATTPATAAKRRICPEWHPSADQGDLGEHEGPPPEIAADMRRIVSASRTVLTIQSLSGDPICVPLSWIDTVDEFYLSDGQRLLDFDHEGFEDRGHFLVDRRSRQAIETGSQPESSDDGTMLVAVPPGRHDEGGIDDIGVWQVLKDRVVQRAMLPLPAAEAWRVDRLASNDCAELSAVSPADYWGPEIDGSDSDAADAAIAKLPHLHFRVRRVGGRWTIEQTRDGRPCVGLEGMARQAGKPHA